MHTPVLLQKVIEGLQIKPGNKYIDATIGEGGHTKAILEKGAYVLGIDRNQEQITRLESTLHNERLKLVQGNFADIEKIAKENDFVPVEGILFDLGLSWRQLSELGKGFSYRPVEEPLDMRLDHSTEQTGEYILNTFTQEQLYNMIATNSEEVKASDIAEAIVQQRKGRKFKKVGDLNRTIASVVGENAGKTYARIYQAIRIEVNDEFGNLRKGLTGALKIVRPGGKIAIISFHSLEDRIVKQFMREKKVKMESKNAIAGDRTLSFERSSKLRVFTV